VARPPHVERTLAAPEAARATTELGGQYALALGGTVVVAVALGWVAAGRVLAPLRSITRTAREVSEQRLDRRVALAGPRDELRDLTDTVDAMLDRLATAFDGQKRFVANASHELRTPLTVIRAEVEVTLADPDADVRALRAMGETVLEATRRTEGLLDSLMVLARSQQAVLRREPVDLAAAARAALRHLGPEIRRNGLAVELVARPAAVEGEARLVERLVGNLVENAVRHNHAGGYVSVETRRENDHALVRVVNSGEVLPPQAIHRMAEPFERLNRDCDGSGAGLGLSIVRSVATRTAPSCGWRHVRAAAWTRRSCSGHPPDGRSWSWRLACGGPASTARRRSASTPATPCTAAATIATPAQTTDANAAARQAADPPSGTRCRFSESRARSSGASS
jgi:signal transduction histidine kinase